MAFMLLSNRARWGSPIRCRALSDTGIFLDENTIRLIHFDSNLVDSATKITGTLTGDSALTPNGKFGGGVQFFTSSAGSCSFPGLASSPSAFTIDFWCKWQALTDNFNTIFVVGTTLNESQTGYMMVGPSKIQIRAPYQHTLFDLDIALETDIFYHIALTYDGTTHRLFIDGVLQGSVTDSAGFNFTRKLWLGSFYDYSTTYCSDAIMDEFRISNIARWTANFTPPTAASR